MPQQNDVERSIERLQEVLQGTRVTRARLQQARASNPEHTARRGMSETSDIGEQQPATERQGPTSATISRQFRAEREGEISFDDPDFSRPDGSFLTSNDYSREAGAVGGRLPSPQNIQRQLESPVTNPQVQDLINSWNQATESQRGRGRAMSSPRN